MTPFSSVCLIRRDGEIVFRRPRKERPTDPTQARKAAARFWNRTLKEGDALVKVVVLRERSGQIEIAERPKGERDWTEYTANPHEAAQSPHLAACMGEIGIDADHTPPAVPDVLVINGFRYLREI